MVANLALGVELAVVKVVGPEKVDAKTWCFGSSFGFPSHFASASFSRAAASVLAPFSALCDEALSAFQLCRGSMLPSFTLPAYTPFRLN